MSGVRLAAPSSLADLAARFGGEVDREAEARRVDAVSSPEAAEQGGELLVVTSARVLPRALELENPALVSAELASRLPEGRRWVHRHADWALAELLDLARPAEPARPLISPSAEVEPGAELAEDVRLGPGAVVLAGARIGRGSSIGANAVIYGGASLGCRVVVGPLAVIGRPGFGFVTGPGGEVRRVPQLGGVVVEDDVEIGALVSVDAGTLGPTVIGRGAKLDAHVHVGHNAEIGAGTMVAAQTGFAGSVRVGPGVLVGGQAGFKDHVAVGAGARIGAKSGVIGDIPPGAVVAGFPAQPRLRWLRAMSKLLSLADRK